MRFVWDEDKRQINLRKHRLDFTDAEVVFNGLALTIEDDRFKYSEQRFITIGILDGQFVVIAYVERDNDITRIISMRKATKHEEIIFFKAFGNR